MAWRTANSLLVTTMLILLFWDPPSFDEKFRNQSPFLLGVGEKFKVLATFDFDLHNMTVLLTCQPEYLSTDIQKLGLIPLAEDFVLELRGQTPVKNSKDNPEYLANLYTKVKHEFYQHYLKPFASRNVWGIAAYKDKEILRWFKGGLTTQSLMCHGTIGCLLQVEQEYAQAQLQRMQIPACVLCIGINLVIRISRPTKAK